MRGAIQFDNLGCSAAPFVRDLGHVSEGSEEHIDGPADVDCLAAAVKLGVDKPALKPDLNGPINEKAGTLERHKPAPNTSEKPTVVRAVRSLPSSLTQVNLRDRAAPLSLVAQGAGFGQHGLRSTHSPLAPET
jgi:hypothetical protein